MYWYVADTMLSRYNSSFTCDHIFKVYNDYIKINVLSLTDHIKLIHVNEAQPHLEHLLLSHIPVNMKQIYISCFAHKLALTTISSHIPLPLFRFSHYNQNKHACCGIKQNIVLNYSTTTDYDLCLMNK